MNDTTETTVEMVEVPSNEITLVPHDFGDSEAAPAEATVFIAEDSEAVSVPY